MTDRIDERRAHYRIPLNARIRVRAVGSSGFGHLCRVHDSSHDGMRLAMDHPISEGCELLEVLTESGRHYNGLAARVIWIDRHDGSQHVGCVFEE